jgi:integrase/recombinase XerC
MITDGFLEYLRAERRYSENTVSSYGRDVRRFLSDSGIDEAEFDPALVSADDVRRWIISLSEAGMSASSVNRMTSSLRALFRWLRKKGMVVGDPFLRVNHLKTPNHLPSYIPESQMHTVMDEVEEEFASDDFTEMTGALIIIVFYSTGIRLAELAGIRLGDFSSDFRELKIHGKGG